MNPTTSNATAQPQGGAQPQAGGAAATVEEMALMMASHRVTCVRRRYAEAALPLLAQLQEVTKALATLKAKRLEHVAEHLHLAAGEPVTVGGFAIDGPAFEFGQAAEAAEAMLAATTAGLAVDFHTEWSAAHADPQVLAAVPAYIETLRAYPHNKA